MADAFEARKRFRLDKYTDLKIQEVKNGGSVALNDLKSASVIWLKLRRLLSQSPSGWSHSQEPRSSLSSSINRYTEKLTSTDQH